MTSLAQDLSKLSRHLSCLRRLLDETSRAYNEISNAGICENLSLNIDTARSVAGVVEKPLLFLVLGHGCHSKATVVNSLIGDSLLPERGGGSGDGGGLDVGWRMVCISFGRVNEVSVAFGSSYEVVDCLQTYEQDDWQSVPETCLRVKNDDPKDSVDVVPVVEVKLHHQLLRNGAQIIIPPRWPLKLFSELLQLRSQTHIPVVIYVLLGSLTEQDVQELRELKSILPNTPVFFLKLHPAAFAMHQNEMTESQQHAYQQHHLGAAAAASVLQEGREGEESPAVQADDNQAIIERLVELGYLRADQSPDQCPNSPLTPPESVFAEGLDSLHMFSDFACRLLRSELVSAALRLNENHNRSIQLFILCAFDMAREMQITPRRLDYAREKEAQLFRSLMSIASRKQEEMGTLVLSTVTEMREGVLEKAANHKFLMEPSSRTASEQAEEIRDLVLSQLNTAIAGKLIGSVNCLRDTFLGTLQRCLESLERDWRGVQDVSLASSALRQTLNAAYRVELTGQPSSSFLRTVLERMKQLLGNLPWGQPPQTDAAWKQRVAAEMLDSLSQSKLAKAICSQFRDRLKASHEAFLQALRQLEWHHSGRLERTEERGLKLRKVYAPRVARLALESASLIDTARHGMPVLGRELGRGQYGVVYSCESWGGRGQCAVKSVVPPDDKHWNDLAMEFHYTRSIPEHERIVRLYGSVVDYSHGCGVTPAVLLIMERMERDLYCALKAGLRYRLRMEVAIHVVQGIRYLHSQGLVHRDIKLKNVLLDKNNHAKITDLGFCKPEAMISGSIVGTPVHMAPELFTGQYDSSVDVYAFGILFWYICSGGIHLPYVFEQCQNKEQLWTNVRKGIRPERLTKFDSESWSLMQECWNADSSKRPLLGNVEPRLAAILERHLKQQALFHVQEIEVSPDQIRV